MYLCFFWSARRRSEILDLRIQDIESGVIVDGNTRRAATIYHFRGKGHKGIDDVNELPVEAAEALSDWLSYSGKLRDGKPTDPLFTSLPGSPSQYGYDPERPLAPHTIHAQIKRYALKSGIDPARISCHSFRHTAARCRFEASGDLRAVQRLLRHSNVSTTDTYLAVLAGKADPTASLLSARFGNL